MRISPYIRATICCLGLVAGSGLGFAQTTLSAVNQFSEIMRDYNAVVLNNGNFQNSNMQGSIAVRNNLTTSGGSIAYGKAIYANSPNPTLYVGGTLTVNGETKLESGYASLPGSSGQFIQVNANQRHFKTSNGGKLNMDNLTAPQSYTDPRNSQTNPPPANWNWATIESQAISLSAQLAAANATGTIQMVNQTLTFSSVDTSPGVVVFNLDASLLSGNYYNNQMVSGFNFAIGENQTFVINVLNADGKTLLGSAMNMGANSFTGAGGAGQLLWNITGSGNVTLGSNGGDFYGSILAPEATINNGRLVDGQILARNLNYSNVQLHYTDFSPTAVLIPEPGTYALWTLGLCGAGLWWHRRRSRPSRQ